MAKVEVKKRLPGDPEVMRPVVAEKGPSWDRKGP